MWFYVSPVGLEPLWMDYNSWAWSFGNSVTDWLIILYHSECKELFKYTNKSKQQQNNSTSTYKKTSGGKVQSSDCHCIIHTGPAGPSWLWQRKHTCWNLEVGCFPSAFVFLYKNNRADLLESTRGLRPNSSDGQAFGWWTVFFIFYTLPLICRESFSVREAQADFYLPLTSTHSSSYSPSVKASSYHPSLHIFTPVLPTISSSCLHTTHISYKSCQRSFSDLIRTAFWPIMWMVCDDRKSSKKACSCLHSGTAVGL